MAIWILWAVAILDARADDSPPLVELPPIISEGAPADLLLQDPAVPSIEGQTDSDQGSGSLLHGLSQRIPLPVSETGRPGSISLFRGLGARVEDTSVEIQGVPLNYPQGGGLDFSAFPQFLWAGYRYRLGPALASADARASSGRLALTSWTAQAITTPSHVGPQSLEQDEEPFLSRVGLLVSNANQMQASVGVAYRSQVAVIAGYSDGDARGPSGGLSGKWSVGERVSGRYHLLATRIDAASPGTRSLPTPSARQLTARAIPVVEADVTLPQDVLWKASVFLDGSFLQYDSPELALHTRDHVWQLGTENAVVFEDWKAGLSYRRVSYSQLGFEAPVEDAINMQGTRELRWKSLLIEPTLGVGAVSRFGAAPLASVGARYALRERLAGFARITHSRRHPTLADRYYELPGLAVSNPGLKPEQCWTLLVGGEWSDGEAWETVLTAYAQARQDAQISSYTQGVYQVVNAGGASVLALLHTLKFRPSGWIDLSHSASLPRSRIDSSGSSFPYLPDLTEVLSAEAHAPGDRPAWGAGVVWRLATSAAVTSDADRIPGYGSVDLYARLAVLGLLGEAASDGLTKVDISARIENIFDRPIELIRDIPTRGRTISFALTGEL